MRTRHWEVAVESGICLLLLAPVSSAQAARPEFDRRVQAILEHWETPGAAIAIVKDSNPLLAQGYGSTRVVDGKAELSALTGQ
jgi:CubicO group peptidase (beta-lactamase class C family)